MNVPEVALMDIYDSNTGTELQPLHSTFGATQTGVNRELVCMRFQP
jgi:hypothetical protein